MWYNFSMENSQKDKGEGQRNKSETALREEEVLKFWKEDSIFEKSLAKESPKGEFVFYDGPPFATGLPHYGSLLPSIAKDVIPRYKTMKGYHVRRRWGWDCHGLPIENMIEKRLGLKDKKEILDIGIEKFNQTCRDAVLEYADQWQYYIERVGRWVDFENSYKTMDTTYTESVWWALKNIWQRGFLYEGKKVLLYCPHCETPLAKAEIAQDNSYKDVTEETTTVKFKVKSPQFLQDHGLPDNTYLLAWTTTPWTLPGNVALAVGKDIHYSLVKQGVEYFILATDLIEKNFNKESGDYSIEREILAKDLIGLLYEPLFDIPKIEESGKRAHYVTEASFVTTDDGTGIVHTAVMYGEDDYELGLKINLPMVPLLDERGHFNNDAPELVQGDYFKKAEKAIKQSLEERDLMFKKINYTHSYPHCHRCDTALIYNALSSWFINIQKVKDKLIKSNENINWFPQHLKHGRFLNIIKSAPDWTISRNRYWASPLPIWKCGKCNTVDVLGSIDELRQRTKKSGNKYFVMRHGEATSNVTQTLTSNIETEDHVTEAGKEQVKQAVKKLREYNIDIIVASPFIRTRETVEIIKTELNIGEDNIIFDDRLVETQFGDYDGRPYKDHDDFVYRCGGHKFTACHERGESYQQVKRRMTSVLYDFDTKYKEKNILVISHGTPIWMLLAGAKGLDVKAIDKTFEEDFHHFGNAELRPFDFVPLSHIV